MSEKNGVKKKPVHFFVRAGRAVSRWQDVGARRGEEYRRQAVGAFPALAVYAKRKERKHIIKSVWDKFGGVL
jgi:hypothetical protein